jgi:hypothetical protein
MRGGEPNNTNTNNGGGGGSGKPSGSTVVVRLGGPCQHCHVSTSVCWRRGPPEKPVLCNACGSRFLVKANLEG